VLSRDEHDELRRERLEMMTVEKRFSRFIRMLYDLVDTAGPTVVIYFQFQIVAVSAFDNRAHS